MVCSDSLSISPCAANDYGLFLSDEDPKKGIWLEAGKALDYYMLRNGVSQSSYKSLCYAQKTKATCCFLIGNLAVVFSSHYMTHWK